VRSGHGRRCSLRSARRPGCGPRFPPPRQWSSVPPTRKTKQRAMAKTKDRASVNSRPASRSTKPSSSSFLLPLYAHGKSVENVGVEPMSTALHLAGKASATGRRDHSRKVMPWPVSNGLGRSFEGARDWPSDAPARQIDGRGPEKCMPPSPGSGIYTLAPRPWTNRRDQIYLLNRPQAHIKKP
jgi:hypothetical protein